MSVFPQYPESGSRALKWVLKQATRGFQGTSGSFEDWDDAEKTIRAS